MEARYAIAVTPHVAALIGNPDDPIGRQYLPDVAELTTLPHESADPTADAPFTPVKGVVHRYPDRALLKPLLACPVYCRFCFRREHVGPGGGLLTDAELDAALAWFAATPTVREAILTGAIRCCSRPGGLAASSMRWKRCRISSCCASTPACRWRIRRASPTRSPPCCGGEKPLALCVHANHAREFGGAGAGGAGPAACGRGDAAWPIGAARRRE